MSKKMLVITDDVSFEELKAHSELPVDWLHNAETDSHLFHSLHDQTEPWILRTSSEMLLPIEGEDSHENSLGDQGRDELFHSFTEMTIVYLAVIDAPQPSSIEVDQTDSSILNSKDNQQSHRHQLGYHLDWYQQFRKRIVERTAERESHVGHALILIFREKIPSDQLPLLKQITNTGDERLFDVSYVMMDSLEPGEERDMFFHSHHVWALAVNGLLLKLLHDRPTDLRSDNVYAWRSYHLVPEIPKRKWENFCQKQFEIVKRKLTEFSPKENDGELSEISNSYAFSETAITVDFDKTNNSQKHCDMPWIVYPASSRLETVTTEGRWKEELDRAGETCSKKISNSLMSGKKPVWNAILQVWKSVHTSPRFILSALVDLDKNQTVDLKNQYLSVTEQWDEITNKDEQRRLSVEHTKECIEHYSQARNAFLGIWTRLLVVVAVSLVVGIVSITLLSPLLGEVRSVAAVVGGIIGSFITALFSLDHERRRGRKGQLELENQITQIDKIEIERHTACLEAVGSAHVFWQQCQASATKVRLHQLLSRVRLIFEKEFKPPFVIEHTQEDSQKEGFLQTSSRSRGIRQRIRLKKATYFEQTIEMDFNFEDSVFKDHQSTIDKLIQAEFNRFQSELWQNFCKRYDRKFSGHLPASYLIPLIREFCDQFHASLQSMIRSIVTQEMGVNDQNHWSDCIRKAFTHQSYNELMSCHIQSHETASDSQQSLPVLYVQPNFDANRLVSDLSGVIASRAIEFDQLTILPVAGFVFQHMPIKFESNTDSKIEVAPY